MLQILRDIEEQMPNFLKIESWRSLYIDYDYPYVERVYLDWEEYRINLHIIHPIPEGQVPYYHPHPWPSACRILRNAYRMRLGLEVEPDHVVDVSNLVMSRNSAYEMVFPNTWHAIEPLNNVNVPSLMITGKPYGIVIPNQAGHQLKELSQERVESILELFRYLYAPEME